MSNPADLTLTHGYAILILSRRAGADARKAPPPRLRPQRGTNEGEAMEIEHDLMFVEEHKGTLAEFQAKMEELHRRARGEGEWNDEAWDALDAPTLNY
ncbi:MAG: hypothetical protein HOI21_00105 [Bacteroidetes Order II. Incertae sedis bacterium]|nr:hypothetical protein [Bacteroidetes Order II. bacterium]